MHHISNDPHTEQSHKKVPVGAVLAFVFLVSNGLDDRHAPHPQQQHCPISHHRGSQEHPSLPPAPRGKKGGERIRVILLASCVPGRYRRSHYEGARPEVHQPHTITLGLSIGSGKHLRSEAIKTNIDSIYIIGNLEIYGQYAYAG
jgi:hypothetical protein